MKGRKLMSVVLAMGMGMSLASAAMGAETEAENIVDTDHDVVTFNALESESWDPLRDSQSGNLMANMYEGLTEYIDGEVALGAAKSITLADDAMSAEVILRDDGKWSDGKAVTAGDFVYSIMRQLNPDSAAKYAANLYFIKNATEYNAGEAAAEDVGLSAKDDSTLEITFAYPMTENDLYEQLADQTAYPVREDAVEGSETWWSDPSTCLTNDPFMLQSYTPNDSLVMVKNPNYRDFDSIKIDELDARFITDSQVELMAYKSGELQIGIMPPSTSLAEYEESGELYSKTKASWYGLDLNMNEDVFQDEKVRKALALSIDRESLVENVTKGGEVAAYSLISPIIQDLSKGISFNDVEGQQFTEDVDEAKKLMEEAGYPNGEGFPTLTYGISSDSYHAAVAQAIAAMWKENLGINVEIQQEELSTFIQDRHSGAFPIARYTNGSNFTSPAHQLELYLSTGDDNDSFYANPDYDDLLKKAAAAGNVDERYSYYQQANALLMSDMPVIPLFYPVNNYLINTNLKGVGINNGGRLDFTHAYFTE